ncbi:TadE/TadG family type IV pilus assembly protein [Pseudoduganella violaceinigra]|uniref:TadE/TadG family type IV pilus assembly protein n=1 Tax=Pseudoduganella violaceinigra TaxID=246602 RepID=UPI0003FD4921|nr:TadE/TadG family type IV pilus assembly protein [Pseudoduganella violaceinigra]
MKNPARRPSLRRQTGAAIVEFAIIGGLLLAFIYAIFEFGRMMFVYNTMQEISRRGAREATVRWVSDAAAIKSVALFGATTLPGGPEITSSNISIRYLRANGVDEVTTVPLDAGDNLSACNDITRTTECIMYVEVSVKNVQFSPLIFKAGAVTTSRPTNAMPQATTIVYAESLGFTN